MKKVLVVIDMQNDFIDGSLGSKEAASIVPNVAKKIKTFEGDEIFVTFDTHQKDYLNTLEGLKLPLEHCIEDTHGHELNTEILNALKGKNWTKVVKTTFGTFDIVGELKKFTEEEFEFEVVGLCTDVCVVSNALILRAGFPNSRVTVFSSCCAGITPQTHQAALETMKSCQIDIV